MAAFTWNYLISYVGNGDGADDPIGTGTLTGTLDDGEPDGLFDSGDSITSPTPEFPSATSNGVYIGTAVVDGNTWPVFYHAASNESVIYLNVPSPPSTPFAATLQVSETDTFDAPCFLTGTMIATPTGETPVEALRIGDIILTAEGAAVAVKWIGHRQVATRFAPAARLMPVCIDAGAMGHGLPRRDLRVTADHALLIDGLLVTAGALVNGTTIRHLAPSDLGGSYTVYHVETEAHEVILAEGMPAETYIDYVGRQAFENHAEYLALYGAERPIAEMPQPRITTARQLPQALRARLGMDRAA
ncbi:Hint domain-containing protein [Roseicyclus marinus]|uniref:Hint domain-containing protein n=1 Tax=Roseicyclus marinus TaxID=2161673 RepID=UPI00240F5141|nr:Hint domain-containing protein [Roseicyclus marinus]MDG3040594.1 Hint domain-containing protein [Roseicyclus marinus]